MSFQGEIVRDDLDINIKTIDKNAFKYVNNKKKVNIVHRIILPWSFFHATVLFTTLCLVFDRL